jgi:cobalt-zinc-cadmium efflux system membrane fusion protein
MNGKAGLVVMLGAVIGLGGGATAISWTWAQQAPEDTAFGHDPNHADEDHDQPDPHKHGQEQDGHGEDDHDEHEDADGHGDHAGHDDHDEESVVRLSEEERKRFGVEVAVAGAGTLATRISLPGEIVLNADRVAHVVPRAPGIVREVRKNVGDAVRAGEVMAWLESAELGEAKVDYLAKWSELGCCTMDLTRAQEVHDNTVQFLEVLNSTPSLETLRDINGSAMGENRSTLVSAYAEFVYSKAAYEREKPLFEKKVASERDFQAAEAEYKKADALYAATRDSIAFEIRRDLLESQRAQRVREIELKGARRRLYVLGLTSEEIAELEAYGQPQPSPATQQAACTDPNCKDCQHAATGADGTANTDATADEEKLAWYPLRAPFDGKVIEKHLTLGEKHSDDAGVFTVADLSSVWVDLAVYQKDLAFVTEGMSVTVSAGAGMPRAHGTIAYVSPVVDEKTRTATARVVLSNSSGEWRPGLFVTAEMAIEEESAAIVVPKPAIQRIGEDQVVFLDTSEGLKPVPVSVGRSSASRVEVLSGLVAGQRYVTQGAFELKAKIVTSGLGAHAGHGH